MGDPIIRAECHDDNRAYEITFDAAKWFKQATFQDLYELAECDWRGDYPADNVAIFMAARNKEVATMFDFIHRVADTRLKCGFECSVNAEDARKWLAANRPKTDLRFRQIEAAANAIATTPFAPEVEWSEIERIVKANKKLSSEAAKKEFDAKQKLVSWSIDREARANRLNDLLILLAVRKVQ